MVKTSIYIASLCLSSLFYLVQANADSNQSSEPQIVPQSERQLAENKKLEGPTKNQGIKSVTLLGQQDLARDFKAMQGRTLRAREIVIEPGGIVAVHEHDSRPGIAYILEGEIMEHRNDQSEPQLRKVGSVAFESSGVAHWWENKTSSKVRALVVDIIPQQ